MKIIIYSKKYGSKTLLIDNEDWETVREYSWHLKIERNGTCYVNTNIKKEGKITTTRIHNLITGFSYVDHINGNGLDNRRINLRESSHATNGKNKKKRTPKSSIYKGVSWNSAEQFWKVSIMTSGKYVYLGCWVSELAAATAYNIAARELHKDYACLNNINEMSNYLDFKGKRGRK